STDSAAGEAERVTQSVAREIASRRGEPGKGLVVVTDVHDALVTTDFKRLYAESEGLKGTTSPEEVNQWLCTVTDDSRQLKALLGPVVFTDTYALSLTELKEWLALPSDKKTPDWAIAMPTKRATDWRCDRSNWEGLWHLEGRPLSWLVAIPYLGLIGDAYKEAA